VHRRIQIIRAGGTVERIAHRDLVTDHQYGIRAAQSESRERARITAGGLFEALAAGEQIAARVGPLPGPVLGERVTLEQSDVDVVEQRLLAQRDRSAFEGDLGGLPRAREAGVYTEIDR